MITAVITTMSISTYDLRSRRISGPAPRTSPFAVSGPAFGRS